MTLETLMHADGCKVVRENGVSIWMCVSACPAMHEFICSGQSISRPVGQLNSAQRKAVIDAMEKQAIAILEGNEEKPC